MCIIKTSRLTKLYKNNRGIKNVSMTVEKGDIYGLLGPNGSGKTTIMKAILGLVKGSGRISVFSLDLDEGIEEIMMRTGALIEAPAIYKDMTALKNLELRAKMYPEVTAERIEAVLEAVNLKQYKNDKAGRFSLGMKQRLGLAMAFLTDPELVILDEPVNGLDIEGVVEIRELIKRLNTEKGTTFLISSHMSGEIEKTCNRIGVMYNGEMIEQTSTEEALRLHPSVEDYFLSVIKDKRGGTII